MRRGWMLAKWCCLCKCDYDSVDNLLIHCGWVLIFCLGGESEVFLYSVSECWLVGIMDILISGADTDSVMPGLDYPERVQFQDFWRVENVLVWKWERNNHPLYIEIYYRFCGNPSP